MKTTLTIEESARLIELGVDAKLASKGNSAMQVCTNGRRITRILEPRPIFELSDLLSILPKEIEDNGITDTLNIWVADNEWCVKYEPASDEFISLADSYYESPELIDALNQLLIWCLENNHIKTERNEQ
ncbi:MAG: hypothetical protein K2G77_08655 [Muribaculaceae bacterium]|nr:hypothetical protein [Muribaculaceae bacterium]